jgi:transposase
LRRRSRKGQRPRLAALHSPKHRTAGSASLTHLPRAGRTRQDRGDPRHRHHEFLDFLRLVARAYPRRQLHVVVDNYATHKHQRVQAWLATHPRVHLHFTPTYGSWLNLVEAFFAIIQRQALGRGDFASVDELVAAIRRFCDGWNQRCQPFAFAKDADQLLAKLKEQPPRQAATRSR